VKNPRRPVGRPTGRVPRENQERPDDYIVNKGNGRREELKILALQEETVNRCFRCGLCRSVCPSFQETGLESASPRGRVQFAKAVLEGRVPLDEAVEERMLDCLNCMRCSEVCPSGVRTNDVVLAARAELAERGRVGFVKKLVFNTVMRSPYLLRAAARTAAVSERLLYDSSGLMKMLVPRLAGLDDKKFPRLASTHAMKRWPEVVPPESGKPVMRVGYFIGCATNMIFTGIADATVRVLTANDIEVVIPRGQACCGIPVYSSGDFRNARRLAERNRRVFDALDVDCIVTDCASCSAALKHEVESLLGVGRFRVPVYDLNEFLRCRIELKRDFREVPIHVTYHDPCHLGRGQGIYEEPRELLKMVPGVEYTELADADSCCGGAGAFSYTHHELSRKVGGRKVEKIRDTGADFVATPCPSCTMQLEDLVEHEGLNVGVIHPVEVLDAAYGNRNPRIEAFLSEAPPEREELAPA